MTRRRPIGLCLTALLAAAGPSAAQDLPVPLPVPLPDTPPEEDPAVATPAPVQAVEGQASARSGRPRRQSRRHAREPRVVTGRSGGMLARRPRAGGPVTQTLLLDATLMAGYDDNVVGDTGGFGAGVPAMMASGTVGTLDTALAYRAGNARHALHVDSRGMVLTYPAYLEGAAVGASASVVGKVSAGRRTAVEGSHSIASEPFFTVASPDASTAAPSQPGQVIPMAGLFERRSIVGRSAVSLTQLMGRSSVTVGYAYGLRRFRHEGEDWVARDTPRAGDNTSHSAVAAFRTAVSRVVRMRTDYQYTTIEFIDALGRLRPNRAHRVEAGLDAEVETSRRRALSLSLTAGVGRLESVAFVTDERYAAWFPVGTANLKLPVSQAWTVDAGYRRDFSLLQGVANDVYANDALTLNLGGFLTKRTMLQVGSEVTRWQAPLPTGAHRTVQVIGGHIEARQMLTRTLGLVATYNYYRHRFAGDSQLPAGFPLEYDRNAVRIGMTIRWPLHGQQAAQSMVEGR